jgi:hypothetical protein
MEIKTQPKRLVDLNPRWLHDTDHGVFGLRYDCPCGAAEGDWESCEVGGHQVVPTKRTFNPEDKISPDAAARGWELTGTSFADITLSPSIHQVGHWHGWLRDGVLVSC